MVKKIHRIIVAPKKGSYFYKIFNLEIAAKNPDLSALHSILANPESTRVIKSMPRKSDKKRFIEVMYNNAVIDPEQDTIIRLCASVGIEVEAAKVSYRYYNAREDAVYVNKLVHVAFYDEPKLKTLKPRGVRLPMQYFDLHIMSDEELSVLSEDRKLKLSLSKMKKLVELQERLGLEKVTDVFLESFAGAWSDHCFHDLWKSLGIMKILVDATYEIGNPNLISAFVDNAGVWDFYDGICLLFKLETHNSPSQKEPYGGQMTKLGGVLRDIFANGLGAKPIGNIEMTVVGEFERLMYPEFANKALPADVIARETIQAIADYGNPMGIPMTLARMLSHPNFSGKPFALGGAVGITTREAAEKGMPRCGDIAVLIGGKTGNDGMHGATISSGGMTEFVDTGDATHVQIGLPFNEQPMMRAALELRDAKCSSVCNDFGALGIVSAFGEPGKGTDGVGGFICNLALVPLKCAGLSNWQISISESQERFAYGIKPDKYDEAMKICQKYDLEATPIGMFTNTGKFQMFYDDSQGFSRDMRISGESCFDVPYSFFDECPLDKVEVVEPAPKKNNVAYPEITLENVYKMSELVVGHFDVADQSWATTQYDSTVQGITWQGPLWGVNYNIPSQIAAFKPVYDKNYGGALSQSFAPWQFEVDPVIAARNAMMDVIVAQVVAGVQLDDIALSDNFYTDGEDPVARWYLCEQVKVISSLSRETGIPFIVGKDSSNGRGTFGGVTAHVLPSVCITALGKIRDVRKLLLHKWHKAGNVIMRLGPQAKYLDGSILSSALGITGVKLDNLCCDLTAKDYLETLYRVISVLNYGACSAVPINQGGIFMRLFQGVEGSGLGIDVEMSLGELFTESFGSVLIETSANSAKRLMRDFPRLNPAVIGEIVSGRSFTINGRDMEFDALRETWSSAFKKKIFGKEVL